MEKFQSSETINISKKNIPTKGLLIQERVLTRSQIGRAQVEPTVRATRSGQRDQRGRKIFERVCELIHVWFTVSPFPGVKKLLNIGVQTIGQKHWHKE